ncbi:MAG: hypothetical protein IPG71_02110 [bacterium]|nr:hypothetical protein [bacterium]
MRLRFTLFMACVALLMSSARAEFFVELYDLSQPIMTACTGGTPVPDSTVIKVFWDSLGNGADDNDPQPPEGTGWMQVNYNQFLLNGASELAFPGGFAALENYVMADGYPDPAQGTGHPVYFLKICVPEGVIWTSDTFRVSPGYQAVFFGSDAGEEPWFCAPGVCADCPGPAVVSNLTASTTYCDSIVLDWDHNGVNVAGYRVLLADEFPQQYVYISGSANTRFVHTNQDGGVDVNYGVRAFNICGTGQDADTAYSPRQSILAVPLLPHRHRRTLWPRTTSAAPCTSHGRSTLCLALTNSTFTETAR